MIYQHIPEEDLQLSALDNSLLQPDALEHLQQCAVCREKVKEYQLLFGDITALSKPSFDFDVAELVMPLLPEKKKRRFSIPVVIAAVLLISGLISLPFFLFNRRIDIFWKSISPWLLGLIGIIGIAFIVMSIADMYVRYRHQLQKLNFE